jgi:putative flippase GtrA/phosphatidylglycerophosphate synthase
MLRALALILSTGALLAAGAGWLGTAGGLHLGAGACDFIDARRRARVSRLDSVLERYVEAAVLVGLAWLHRDSWVLFAVLLALCGSLLTRYVNAGFVRRPERVALLGLALGLSPLAERLFAPGDAQPMQRLAVIGIVILAALTQFTLLQRMLSRQRALGDRAPESRRLLGQRGLLRNVVSSALATGSDFALVALLVSGLAVSPPIATFVGCALGGLVNFSVNRVWAFGSNAPTGRQALRYLFVTSSSAVINSGLMAVMLLVPDVPYVLAWWLVRGAVFAAWNFPLNRDYVFLRSSSA